MAEIHASTPDVIAELVCQNGSMAARIESIVRSDFEGFEPFFVDLSIGNGEIQTVLPAVPGNRIRCVNLLVTWDKDPQFFRFLSGDSFITAKVHTKLMPGFIWQQAVAGVLVLETTVGEALRIRSQKAADYGITGLYVAVP